MLTIGIDPGLRGGLAMIHGEKAEALPMPVKDREVDARELSRILHRWREDKGGDGVRVAIERVHAMPKQGVTSMFNFGCGYGMIRGVCAALRLPVCLVLPRAWKTDLLTGLPHDKDGAITYCTRRWPGVSLVPFRCRKPHDGLADALCIAAWMETQP
jgi:crossover junction endodeoxyribonuclease RuvC